MAALLCTAVMLVPNAPAAAQPATACTPLSPREQAAQTIVTGVAGTRADDAALAAVGRDAGAVVLMGRNVADAQQVAALTAALRTGARAGLLVAVDEEGGRVARLAGAGIAPTLPAARELAATRTAEQVRAAAAGVGAALRAVGVDWNFAPVLDVTAAGASTVIGDRSYSGDPATAGRYGAAFAAGLRDAGVLSTGKHFPGHGRTQVDSHVDLPVVDASLEELAETDLVPFRSAMGDLDAIMTGHVVVTALDPHLPASLSAETARLLREKLGFGGLIVTDDLAMGAVASRWDLATAAEMALAGGADMAMVLPPGHAATAADRIAEAVESGRVPRVRLHDAVRRVLRVKGFGPADATCLLGLPAAASARAVVGDDGVLYAVVDGQRRRIPDPETARELGLADAAGRYDQAEVDALPRGEDLESVRRFGSPELAAVGADPVEVALDLSRARFADGAADRVVVARADDYADALGGTALAGPDAPLLLLPRGAAPPSTEAVAAEVARVLSPRGAVYVLGGQAALSDVDLGTLRSHPGLRRLAGPDRYATAALVARQAARTAARRGVAPRTVLLVRGDGWADAVAAGPLAAARGWPVLLTASDRLPAATAGAVRRAEEVIVVGGPAAVSDAVAAAAGATRRWEGVNRAGTSAAVARDGWDRRAGREGDGFVAVDGGTGWAMALAVSGWAAAHRAPLLLTGPQLAPEVGAYLSGLAYPAGMTATVHRAGIDVPGGLNEIGMTRS